MSDTSDTSDTRDATDTDPGPHTETAGATGVPPRRLERSASNKVIAGVCGGLGQYFGLDPVVFRIAFAVLCVAGPAALLVYAVAAFLLPKEGGGPPAAHSLLGHQRELGTVVAAVFIALGAVILLSSTHFLIGRRVVWAALLIGAGVAVFRTSQKATPPNGAPPSGAPPSGPPPYAPPLASSPPPPAGTTGPSAAATQAPSPPARFLTPVVLSLLLVGAGAAALLDATGAVQVSVVAFLSVALIVVGAALVLGAWRGRAHGLIPVGLVLVVALGAAGAVRALEVPVRGGVGERHWTPVGLHELRPEYRLGMGELTLDLSGVAFDGSTRRVEAAVGMGELVVIVPPDVTVEAHGRIRGGGELSVLGDTYGGRRVSRYLRSEPYGSSGTLILDVVAGVGRVEVRRGTA